MARSMTAQPYLSLDRYRQLLNIQPWAFNGVENPNESLNGCDHIWTQWERDMVAQGLLDAENMLASHLRYYLGYHWLTDTGHEWTDPVQLNWGYVIGGGVQGLTAVTPSASDFTTDPATITVAAASFSGGTGEILVVETSTGLEIVPDKVVTSGANYVISISQYKLIEWDDLENQTTAIDYDAAFPAATWLKLADLTVYREYIDDTDQATITFGPYCCCTCGTAGAGTSYDGVVFVFDPTTSVVRIQMADYDATTDTWTCNYPVFNGCYKGDTVTVSYRAGTTTAPGHEQAILRLAHTYMFVKPCGCGIFDAVWQRDTFEPSVLTAERINCPFGPKDGAWYSWNWTRNRQHGRAFML